MGDHKQSPAEDESIQGQGNPAQWSGLTIGQRLSLFAGDLSGAFADLGTFLPLVMGVFAVQRLDPTGVLVGFGLFALAVALIYRRPVPVQPMKAVAALFIAGGLDASALEATGLLLGVVLSLLALSGMVGRLGRLIPETLLQGIQLGVGLYLVWAGIKLIYGGLLVGGLAMAALLLLLRTPLKPLAALLVLLGAGAWGLSQSDLGLPSLSGQVSLPAVHWPAWESLWVSSREILLPQLALTLTNATLVTAAIAAKYFPEDQQRITPDRLALSTGALNLLLAPFGAFPMCHGAGGLVVQHRFGARTGVAPALFGISCLGLGILLGADALRLLSLLPLAAVGALLVLAGANLAFSRKLREAPPDQLGVMLLIGLLCVIVNVAVGLFAGLLLEWLRRLLMRRRTVD